MSVLERNEVLREIVTSRTVRDDAGAVIEEKSGVPARFADALYRHVLQQAPCTVVEVGMAYAVSSLAILTALSELGGDRRLVSIDPFQHSQWKGIGLMHVERARLSRLHQLVEAPDYFALPDMLRAGTRVDFAYIDGWHTFDYTLLDFWYLDRMLDVGGVVAFNDCGLRSVHRAIRFVLSHRRYQEIDVGLPPIYQSGHPLGRILRRATGRNGADRYFRKVENWEPDWSFYAPF